LVTHHGSQIKHDGLLNKPVNSHETVRLFLVHYHLIHVIQALQYFVMFIVMLFSIYYYTWLQAGTEGWQERL
jgi:hypothetical protein